MPVDTILYDVREVSLSWLRADPEGVRLLRHIGVQVEEMPLIRSFNSALPPVW